MAALWTASHRSGWCDSTPATSSARPTGPTSLRCASASASRSPASTCASGSPTRSRSTVGRRQALSRLALGPAVPVSSSGLPGGARILVHRAPHYERSAEVQERDPGYSNHCRQPLDTADPLGEHPGGEGGPEEDACLAQRRDGSRWSVRGRREHEKRRRIRYEAGEEAEPPLVCCIP